MSDCTCSVLFKSIVVHDTGEASKGEWSVEINVNGQFRRWAKDVAENSYPINYEFRLTSCDTPIEIRVGGREKDPGGHSGGFFDFIEDNDDPLSTFDSTHSSPNADPTILRAYERRTSNRTGDYTMYYEIFRVCKENKIVSKASLVASMKAYGRSIQTVRKAKFKATSDEELLNAAIARLHRGGWKVIGLCGDDVLLEGFMPVGKRERAKDALRQTNPVALVAD